MSSASRATPLPPSPPPPASTRPRLGPPASTARYTVSGYPRLVAEWHPTKNGDVRPDDVTYGSGIKVWWRCPHGPDHEWRATPNARIAAGSGCPFCAGRRVSITNSLAAVRPDMAAQWHPTANGDLTPSQVVAGSTRKVWWRCPAGEDHAWQVSPHDRTQGGLACPFCIGLRPSRTTSLAAVYPAIAAEWHPTKNGDLGPDQVVPGSSRAAWWACAAAPHHEWRAQIANRCLRGSGCPYCRRRRASMEHSLASVAPEIAREWHPTKNAPLTPADVTPRAARIVWWLCPNGHEWHSRVSSRTSPAKRAQCPFCPREG